MQRRGRAFAFQIPTYIIGLDSLCGSGGLFLFFLLLSWSRAQHGYHLLFFAHFYAPECWYKCRTLAKPMLKDVAE